MSDEARALRTEDSHEAPANDGASEWWRVASLEFNKRFDERLRPARHLIGRPDWALVASLALDPECFGKILAAYGFTRRVARWERGELKWWPDTDGPVFLMHRKQDDRAVYIDRYSGAWRTLDNRHHGRDMISLGQFMGDGSLTFGQIAWRIVRLCGLTEVPVVRGT